ncbi:hypothetical protein KL942_004451 [Ogataea angusta]|uniref:RRM domain-containing protein n=1 Tax=Pichia angusta TaxID=870730 RepID=A0AAN6DE02_PICAN|nr:uncharacterized protein KL928_004849 [Ogataea angusta]KAG7816293.1 hypothetical protein KL928_004849 [Ogataea angusta]KAG7822437.1 hypothetical protein KL909_004125 [Ogataea angusta]KAG7827383.1 hypothetical protein KL920_004637 [Ogataea angusta]KAG7837563.1 hypothetical protein KL942_004451 [Ogataea angusta]KAG7847672.1 hypothetical protein KL940_003584 [Ogataea angusta]
MPPKNKVKMDLGSFLADESFGGSWADEEFDMNTLEVPVSGKPSGSRGGGSDRDYERAEYPIPDRAPYTARVSNLPRDAQEDEIQAFFADNLRIEDPFDEIVDFYAPKDQHTGALRGFAFITFKNRRTLEEALKLSGQNLGGRVAYVSVAAPTKEPFGGRGGRQLRGDVDWGTMRDGPRSEQREQRGGDFRGDRMRERAPEPDWGAVRNTPVVREGRRERLPSRREPAPEPDWTAVREGAAVPEPRRERLGPRREPRARGPEPDWGAIRSGEPVRVERAERAPRRERGPEPDWGVARDSVAEGIRKRSEGVLRSKPKKPEPDVDWENLRGSALNKERKPRESKEPDTKQKAKTDGPKQSSFNVLPVEDDEDELVAGAEKLSVNE